MAGVATALAFFGVGRQSSVKFSFDYFL